MSDKQFTLYWLDGKRQVLPGEAIEHAFTQAGYGAGAIRAVDFYMEGDNREYEWNKAKHSWDRKVPLSIESAIALKPDAKYKFFVSHNLGATYVCEYSTDDKADPELDRRIKKAQEKMLRYCVEGDDSVVSPQHKVILDFLGASGHQRSIETQVEMLRSKFCR